MSTKLLAAIVALATAISGVLWWFEVIPWWGFIIGVPVIALALTGALVMFNIFAWMSNGSH